MAKKDLEQLQMLQHNLQQLLVQKQQFQLQLNEIDSAAKELKDAKQAYKIIGNVMLLSDKETLEKELNAKKDMFELRIKNIEAQENRLRNKSDELQKQVVKELKNDD